MLQRSFCWILLSTTAVGCAGLFRGSFSNRLWRPLRDEQPVASRALTFIVALALPNIQELRETLDAVSNPKSSRYGQYLSLEQVQEQFGPSTEALAETVQWLRSCLPFANVDVNANGDLLQVTSTVGVVEHCFNTKLAWHAHVHTEESRPALRAVQPLRVPAHLHKYLSFISLNSPVSNFIANSGKSLRSTRDSVAVETGSVGVSTGNKAVRLSFIATCSNGSKNVDSTPCASTSDLPTISASFQQSSTSLFPSTLKSIPSSSISCYNQDSVLCSGISADNCTCYARLNDIPMYRNLKVNVSATFSDGSSVLYGTSSSFALTDVATVPFLVDLYSMPAGLTVSHGSTMAVAEFYGEFYSNSDLAKFLELSGLKVEQIDDALVVGNLPNNQSTPGGEAQLDVEYIMALAPNASLTFYSIANLNPYSSENEGFLAWLWYVGNETSPPLVQSLSYGDIESAVFNTSVSGASEYAYRCDAEFMKMGVRGITVVVSSGDDGIGNFAVRTDPTWACAAARPSWPASSPFVTTVGATQLTDQYIPVCEELYDDGSHLPLPVQCSLARETTCTSTLGGVITSGGGFSDVYDRATYASWQEDAVSTYLALSGKTPSTTYFNSEGRGYPDVSTYGSNYFVYLDGKIVRESGTSASAPVFAAMVVLLNDLRLAHGESSLGFINPYLYDIAVRYPQAFSDITTGDIACGAGHSIDTVNCCSETFYAAEGWDATTGLGSPNFDVLYDVVESDMEDNTGESTDDEPDGDDEDDEDDKDQRTIAAVAIVALVFGLLALITSVFVLVLLIRARRSAAGNMYARLPLT